jgi:dienelactone hydrolase
MTSRGSAQSLRSRLLEHHRAYVPAKDGVFPTVVAIPGCSGVSLDSPSTDEGRPGDPGDPLFRRHFPRIAKRLRDAGFAVLLVDYLSAEGVLNACNGEIRRERIAEYISEAVGFARSQPFVDAAQVNVIGWSLGGVGLLAWLEQLPEGSAPVRSAIGVYPGCGNAQPWKADVPVLMLLGGADDITPPEQCESLVRSLPDGLRVTVRLYDGARHGFDNEEAPSVVDVGGGRTIGCQSEAAHAAWTEILAFLGASQ